MKMNDKPSGSRLPGFYNLSFDKRWELLRKANLISQDDIGRITGADSLTVDQADHMIENVIGTFPLPLGIALNFVVNGRELLVPMVVEEPSVIAGASFMAKLARASGGFKAETSEPEMIGQIQVLDIPDLNLAQEKLLAEKQNLISIAAGIDPVLEKIGGGPRDIEVRKIESSPIGSFLVVHLIYDVRDAMGANAVNTAVEKISPYIETISGGRAHLRILSNLADRRIAKAYCTIRLEDLAFSDYKAEQVRDGIIESWAFAASDPYRAATHNKGIMNGVDAVVIATGNDWRAVEAGAHAFAARGGIYTSLSTWGKDDSGNLIGSLEMPLAVGIVGGATRVHPGARASIKLMGITSARELAEVIVSVGLAQNLAALRALATEGIQRGHMGLHARQVAISAGAEGSFIERLAEKMVLEGTIRIDRAQELLEEWGYLPSEE